MANNLQKEIDDLKENQKVNLTKIAQQEQRIEELEAENRQLRIFGERMIAAVQDAMRMMTPECLPAAQKLVENIQTLNREYNQKAP